MKIHRFRPGWTASLAAALLLPLFASLGTWQLRRAEEKEALMEQRERQTSEPVLGAGGLAWASDENRYRRVELQGEFDAAHQFLLDNQIFNQQPGYQVLTPLRIEGSDAAVLINRGWVPMGKNRSQLPEIAVTRAKVRLIGVIDKFPGVGFKLKGAEIPVPGWPSVVGLLDTERLSERLGYRLVPYQVLLAADEAGGYARHWEKADLHPERNRGYALQWFSFALALSIFYVWHGFKPKPP